MKHLYYLKTSKQYFISTGVFWCIKYSLVQQICHWNSPNYSIIYTSGRVFFVEFVYPIKIDIMHLWLYCLQLSSIVLGGTFRQSREVIKYKEAD